MFIYSRAVFCDNIDHETRCGRSGGRSVHWETSCWTPVAPKPRSDATRMQLNHKTEQMIHSHLHVKYSILSCLSSGVRIGHVTNHNSVHFWRVFVCLRSVLPVLASLQRGAVRFCSWNGTVARRGCSPGLPTRAIPLRQDIHTVAFVLFGVCTSSRIA